MRFQSFVVLAKLATTVHKAVFMPGPGSGKDIYDLIAAGEASGEASMIDVTTLRADVERLADRRSGLNAVMAWKYLTGEVEVDGF